jgi:hypothetical protein
MRNEETAVVVGCWMLDTGYWLLPARMTRSDGDTEYWIQY